METEKAKLLDFVKNLTPEQVNLLASRYQEIVSLLEANERPYPLDIQELTA